jgi:hypothetical protein
LLEVGAAGGGCLDGGGLGAEFGGGDLDDGVGGELVGLEGL